MASSLSATSSASDASMDRTQEAMGDLFQAPPPHLSLVATAVVGTLVGLVLLPGSPLAGLVVGIVVFAVPGVMAAVAGAIWHRATGGVGRLRRTALLGLIGAGFGLVVALFALLARPWFAVPPVHVAVLAAAVPLWLRVQAVHATAQPDPARAVPDIVLPYVLALVGLPLVLPVDLATWGLALLLGLVFVAGGATVVETIRRLALDDFGADLLSLHLATLEHITEGGDAGEDVLVAFFDAQAIDGEAEIGVVRLEREGAEDVTVVVPTVHPGPFGHLTGSPLPAHLAETLDGAVLPLHGTCTHDQNPVRREDVDRVLEAARDVVDEARPVADARPPVRLTGDVVAQPLGDGVLVCHAPSPDPWDDVDIATGRLARDAAVDAGAEQALVADAHHCTAPGTSSIRMPMPRSREIVDATRRAVDKALEAEPGPLRAGWSRRTGFELDDGVGPAGVRCLVLEAAGTRTAYFLLDGNNAVAGLRETVRDRLLGRVDEAEVLTTDTHVVNLGLDGCNPVGRGVEAGTWADLAEEMVDEALDDLTPARAGFAETTVGIRAFGVGTTDRIATLIHVSTWVARRLMRITLVDAAAIAVASIVILQLLA